MNLSINIISFSISMILMFFVARIFMNKKFVAAAQRVKLYMDKEDQKVVLQPVACRSFGYESNDLDGKVNGILVMTNKSFIFQPLSKKESLWEIPINKSLVVSVVDKFEETMVNVARSQFLVIEPGTGRRIGFQMQGANEHKSRIENELITIAEV